MSSPGRDQNWPKLIQLASAAMQFGALVAGGALMGYFVDREFDVAPWGTLVGLLFGSISAFQILIFLAKKLTEDDKDRKRRGDGRGQDPGP